MQADLDIESYHFHQFVEDLVKVDGGVQRFLNTLYFEWPIADPQKYHHLKRYGHKYETWPQTYEQLQDVINKAEEKLIDTILGAKLRPVASYFKGAATLKELIHDSEATPNEITWPDVQYIFKQQLIKLHERTKDPAADWTTVDMLSGEGEDNHFKISLRYRVPKDMITTLLDGEWRIYHKPGNAGGKGPGAPECSYGMIIKDIKVAGAGGKGPVDPNAGNTVTFCGHDRLNKRYKVEDGHCYWNERGNSHVRMTWTEQWNDGKVVEMEAKLKINGKFECTNCTSGEVKKGAREDNFSTDAHERLKLKYYIGDKDAAFEDKIPFPDLIKAGYDHDQCERMLREIYTAWPTTGDWTPEPEKPWTGKGPAPPPEVQVDPTAYKTVNRKGRDIHTWPLSSEAFEHMLTEIGGDCNAVACPLTEEIVEHTEGTNHCVVWPDVQAAFKKAGHNACCENDKREMMHPKTTLMYKVPLNMVASTLEGEWRMYSKPAEGVAFSYGMYFFEVHEVEDGHLPGHAKKFAFTGRSRVEGQWEMQNGHAIWNEHHTSRVVVSYTEQSFGKGGGAEKIEGRLKVNGKFECDHTDGFFKKARREDTLPEDPHARMSLKYYLGDRDAVFEIDPNLCIGFPEMCAELGHEGIQDFLSHLFFEWPTLPNPSVEVETYGKKRVTWPVDAACIKSCVMHGGKYEEKYANSLLSELFSCESCETTEELKIVHWPDVAHVFRNHLGDAVAAELYMLDATVSLTLKIPEDKIHEMLMGEYRMYCKSTAGKNDAAFSYGLIIESVTETSHVGRMKTFDFTGRPRHHGKYTVNKGKAVWNEFGTGRLFLEYTESWPNGTDDNLRARLKCNGKFTCESTAGFIQKARKEETLPTSTKLRMESKYYAGDTDAANEC